MIQDIFKNEIGLEIKECVKLGGMSNINYLVTATNGEQYVLRISGKNSNDMINRKKEKHIQNILNLAHRGGVGVDLKDCFKAECVYIDDKTGVKITKFLKDAITLKKHTIKEYIPQIATRLKMLHSSELDFKFKFDPQNELKKYLKLGENLAPLIPNLNNGLKLFAKLEYEINKLGVKFSPTHGDLVPENILALHKDVIFIDWEYGGINDACWDIASLFVESDFTLDMQDEFYRYYKPEPIQIAKTELYKSLLDILWCVWSIAKNEKEYLGYAKERLKNALLRHKL